MPSSGLQNCPRASGPWAVLEALGRHLFKSPSEKGGILAQNTAELASTRRNRFQDTAELATTPRNRFQDTAELAAIRRNRFQDTAEFGNSIGGISVGANIFELINVDTNSKLIFDLNM